MINADMRTYDYYTFGDENEYGQAQLSATPKGQITIAIYNTTISVEDNISYTGKNYIGLTMAQLDDSYVIQYGTEKLKVEYVYPKGRYKQVYLVKL